MRSRYSAFATHNTKYIIKTTHKENDDYSLNQIKWSQDILEFTQNCDFNNLEIIEFIDGETKAFVTFKATIICQNKDQTFTERSTFLKENNLWYYNCGVFLENM